MVIGTIKLKLNDEIIGECELVANMSVSKNFIYGLGLDLHYYEQYLGKNNSRPCNSSDPVLYCCDDSLQPETKTKETVDCG